LRTFKTLKMLMLVAAFTLLAACGKNPADKFVGEWVDPRPPKVEDKDSWFGPADPLDVTIEAISPDKVEITMSMLRTKKKMVFEVEGNKIIGGGGSKVFYTLEGDELISELRNGVRLVRKK